MGLGTWIANLVTAGEYARRGRLLIIDQELYKSEKRAIEFLEMGLKDYGDQIYMLSEAVDKWRETARRAIQGRDENYRAYQQELRTNRALQARLDEALLVSWTEARGLRDGWEQTAGELQAQVLPKRREHPAARRPNAIEACSTTRVSKDAAAIERLEAEVKRLGRNVQRGSYGRSEA